MKCSHAEIQTLLRENASCDEDIRLSGFDFMLSKLQYCERYRSFLKYIKSLNGVEAARVNGRAHDRGFKGISINHI